MIHVYCRRPSSGAASLVKCMRGLGTDVKRARTLPQSGHVITWGTQIDKLNQLRLMEAAGVPVVPFTTDQATATAWLQRGGAVYARTKLRGKSGDGIVFLHDPDQEMVRAPLYTQAVMCAREYRVHVADNQVQVIPKLLKRGHPPSHIRNHDNGYVYGMSVDNAPDPVINAARAAMDAVSRRFGAVDVIWDGGRAWVLEVNTAPGLEKPETLEFYARYFMRVISDGTSNNC